MYKNIVLKFLQKLALDFSYICRFVCNFSRLICVASVSVWFRNKERPRNDEELDFRFWLRSLTLVPRYFIPKRHGNACSAGQHSDVTASSDSYNTSPLFNTFFRGTQRQFLESICSEDELRSRIFETFVVKFLACLSLLGFSNI